MATLEQLRASLANVEAAIEARIADPVKRYTPTEGGGEFELDSLSELYTRERDLRMRIEAVKLRKRSNATLTEWARPE